MSDLVERMRATLQRGKDTRQLAVPIDLEDLEALIGIVAELERVPCPECDGSGEVVLGEVSHDMAVDACDPSLEGQIVRGRCDRCGGDGMVDP